MPSPKMIRRLRRRDVAVGGVSLLLVVAVVAMTLVRQRSSARSVSCQSNLRQIGLALHNYARSDPQTAFCSGAMDARLDGWPERVGWVRDIRDQLNASTLMDPGSDLAGTKAIADLITIQRSASPIELQELAETKPNSPERVQLIREALVTDGLSTNYCVSWLLARTEPKTVFDFDHDRERSDPAFDQFRTRDSCHGSLTQALVDRSRLPAANLPMVGCGNTGQHAELFVDLAAPATTMRLVKGAKMAATMTSGPSFYDREANEIGRLVGGVSLAAQTDCERAQPSTIDCVAPTGPEGNGLYLQDTRQWTALHNGQLNLLMTDGAVKAFQDRSGDRLLNPGFVPRSEVSSTGAPEFRSYNDGDVELPVHQFYGGVTFREQNFSGYF
ncbi:MAG: DUF1559 domain-containing protein [Planctomycetota bacterium]